MDKKEEKGEIVLYQPDGEVRLEVRVENETVWLNRFADNHSRNRYRCGHTSGHEKFHSQRRSRKSHYRHHRW